MVVFSWAGFVTTVSADWFSGAFLFSHEIENRYNNAMIKRGNSRFMNFCFEYKFSKIIAQPVHDFTNKSALFSRQSVGADLGLDELIIIVVASCHDEPVALVIKIFQFFHVVREQKTALRIIDGREISLTITEQ